MSGNQVVAEWSARLADVADAAAVAGLKAVLVTPGGDLHYLIGYRGSATTERLTCLVVAPGRVPILLLPRLEHPLVLDALAYGPELELVTWDDGEDSLDRLAGLIPGGTGHVAVDEQMWSARVLGLAGRISSKLVSARPVLEPLRSLKSPGELAFLAAAGQAIDVVHAEVPSWLRPGRSEREVGADIAAAILAAGHDTVEFVIVGSGRNSASAHAELTDRVIEAGEPIVVDIGGRMPSGYNSDCTRTYMIGEARPEFSRLYATLQQAQQLQCESAVPGVTAQELDAVGRRIIEEAGYGEYFVHRTGHGIGLDIHEQPYIVAGSLVALVQGAVFSIEPGIYLPGVGGARIEDIVVCDASGARRLNQRSRDLFVI